MVCFDAVFAFVFTPSPFSMAFMPRLKYRIKHFVCVQSCITKLKVCSISFDISCKRYKIIKLVPVTHVQIKITLYLPMPCWSYEVKTAVYSRVHNVTSIKPRLILKITLKLLIHIIQNWFKTKKEIKGTYECCAT